MGEQVQRGEAIVGCAMAVMEHATGRIEQVVQLVAADAEDRRPGYVVARTAPVLAGKDREPPLYHAPIESGVVRDDQH
jgi:hypothetical protein